MTRHPRPSRRGLTMLEFVLALAITAMVAIAISGMLTAVASGERLRRDNRAFVVRSHVAKSRLAAYVAKSRCILDADGANAVLWLDDSRASETVHATEIRWLIFDSAEGTLDVHFVDFPPEWTDVAKDLEDAEYPSNADWAAIWTEYESNGYISELTLVDGLQGVSVTTDQADPMDSKEITFDLDFTTGTTGSPMSQAVSVMILEHAVPTN